MDFKKHLKIILRLFKKIYPAVLSIFLLFFLIKIFKVENIYDITGVFSWSEILISLVFYVLIKIQNTFRFSYFYHFKNYFRLFLILCISNLFLNIIPFRIGEIAYVKYFKRYLKLDYKESALKLAYIRIFDYFVIVCLFFVSLLFVDSSILELEKLVYFFIFISSFFLIIFGFFYLFFKNNRLIVKFLIYIQSFKKITKKDFVLVFFNSLIYWILRLGLGFLLMYFVDIRPGFMVIVFFSTLIMTLEIIPIKTYLGFGFFEGAWVYLLGLLNFNTSSIFNKILAVHLLSVFNVLILGLISLAILNILARNKSRHTYSVRNISETT